MQMAISNMNGDANKDSFTFHATPPRFFPMELNEVKNALPPNRSSFEGQSQYVNSHLMEYPYRDRPESWEKYKISTAALSDVSSCDPHSPVQDPTRPPITFYQYLQSPQGQDLIREWTGQDENNLGSAPPIPLSQAPLPMLDDMNQSVNLMEENYDDQSSDSVSSSNNRNDHIPSPPPQPSTNRGRKQTQKRRASEGSTPIIVKIPPKKRQKNGSEPDQNRNLDRKRRRRESHNAVERRRRDLINERIAELAMLLPGNTLLQAIQNSTGGGTEPHINLKPFLPPKEEGGEITSHYDTNGDIFFSTSENGINLEALAQSKPNKGIILTKSVEYIKHLHQVCDTLRKEITKLQSQIHHFSSSSVGVVERGEKRESGEPLANDEYYAANSNDVNNRSPVKMSPLFRSHSPVAVSPIP